MTVLVSLRCSRAALVLVLSALIGFSSYAQRAQETPNGDQQGSLQLEAAKKNPLQLRHFLLGMPKGADLHYHLAGGVYAESFIREAVEDGLCVDTKKLAFVKCPLAGEEQKSEGKIVLAEEAYKNQALYEALVNSFSMRSFLPYAGVSGHDHFFDSFAKFDGTNVAHHAEWVDEAATRAAAQNVQYMELMETPDFSLARAVAARIGWNEDLKLLREQLLAGGLAENVKNAVAQLNGMEKKRREIEHCGEAKPADACKVNVRFLYQVLRGLPKEIVFAQTVVGFEAASADPERIVGINFVMPEDGYVSMKDYELHMRMVTYLHETYPKVHITLHAGELAYGLVPPEGLCCHVRRAVEAGAERIGHGVDILYEERPHELLKEMAAKHVMVEINLTSNDVILGVSGKNHPLPLYRQFKVPVALSTDDEGVSRIDLTNEYVRAVETYGLNYVDLKNMARTGLEHAFLPGKSLWTKQDSFTQAASECARDLPRKGGPSKTCAAFLQENEKALEQWELERRFRDFEASF